MARSSGAHDLCPVARAAQLLGDRWTLVILRDLATGCRRFSVLEASTGMSPRVLSGRLRALESEGLLQRRQYAEIPPRVEYTLTEKGRAALPVIDQLRQYGRTWLMDTVDEECLPHRHWRRARRALAAPPSQR
ncbi:MAG: helix-turn-helix transcriptional regulator [Chloroflexi bacterium]|nr:helix-turn-helix transcriptional regulator [Chloroflexota bacterium]MBI4507892.1 helix-turn-helix transcriptional regulator [Chloroflexota bacterium]